jgi:hypothetical protein
VLQNGSADIRRFLAGHHTRAVRGWLSVP